MSHPVPKNLNELSILVTEFPNGVRGFPIHGSFEAFDGTEDNGKTVTLTSADAAKTLVYIGSDWEITLPDIGLNAGWSISLLFLPLGWFSAAPVAVVNQDGSVSLDVNYAANNKVLSSNQFKWAGVQTNTALTSDYVSAATICAGGSSTRWAVIHPSSAYWVGSA